MICPKCATDNRDGAKFCNECGSSLASREEMMEAGAASVDDTRPASDASSAPLQEEGETREEASSVDVDSSVADGEAFEAAIGSSRMTGHESPDEMIREALVEVRSLADTVPPIIEVPEVLPLATVSARAAADERRVDEGVSRAESDGACAFNASSRDDASCSNASTQNPEDDGSSVAAEARAMFGAKDPATARTGSSAAVTADLSGLERLVDSSYVPPSYTGRVGDTMELPVVGSDVRPQSQSYIAQPDKKETRRQKRAQRKLEQEMAKRERELQKQGATPLVPAASGERSGEPAPLPGGGESDSAKGEPATTVTSAEGADLESSQKTKSPSAGKRKLVYVGIAIAVLLVCAIAAAATYQMELWGGKIVPGVEGLSQADATSVLEEKGFSVEVVEEKSDGVEGVVLSSDPGAGGRAQEGSAVVINVSVARVVPDILGSTELEARKAFEAEGLVNVEYELVKSNDPEGTVLSVSPDPGTRLKASEHVKVQVAQAFTVPDVVNKTSAEAIALLEEEGYVVKSVRFDTEDVPEGTVVSVDPASGTKLNSGETVTISVAHNRSVELVSLTKAFFTDAGTVTINGLSYQVSEVTSVSYSGNNTCAFSIVARPFETHTWMFGLGSETRYGNYETINGSITWNDDNSIASTNPVMKQGA